VFNSLSGRAKPEATLLNILADRFTLALRG
jgi:hypothetical protein